MGNTSNTPSLHSHGSQDSKAPKGIQPCWFQIQEGACTDRNKPFDAQSKAAPSEPPAHACTPGPWVPTTSISTPGCPDCTAVVRDARYQLPRSMPDQP